MTLPTPKPFSEVIPLYLSYVPGRSTGNTSKLGYGFKLHNQINHAKNAVSAACTYRSGAPTDMGIWELNMQAQEWELLFHIPEGMRREDFPW